MSLHVLAIVGPTACGKTRLGVEVAHRLGSEIVSADSRQVYRGLDIGTGKDLAEYAEVDPPIPYHLVDVADPEQVYTLFRFQSVAADCMSKPLSATIGSPMCRITRISVSAWISETSSTWLKS